MKVIFLSYSNNTDAPLPTLSREDQEVYRHLAPNFLKQHYILHRDSTASISSIAENLSLFRNHIFLFSYSGHADRDALLLEDDIARAEGIAHQLGQCPNLKVVLLNGCSTYGQVAALQEQGIPCVIATSAPVNDALASNFAIRFFQALKEQASIGEAFELAKGETITSKAINFQRGIVLRDPKDWNKSLWGIFYKEEQVAILKEQLPVYTEISSPENYVPNEKLIDTLMTAIAPYNEEVEELKESEAKGKKVKLAKKRMRLLNALPAPIAEHLRKLTIPVESENEGFDRISINRVQQLSLSYTIMMEFLVFTLLAQLWENKIKDTSLELPLDIKNIVRQFIKKDSVERSVFDYLSFIQSLQNCLKNLQSQYFIEELAELEWNAAFKDACFFFQLLAKKLNTSAINKYEVTGYCIRGEESLAAIFDQLGFIAKYTLAAVNRIDIQKYRHQPKASFIHTVVLLLDLIGGLEEDWIELGRFMDNRSVLLLKIEEGEIVDELNLSPFIIDENAFVEKADVSKIYFYSHYENGFKYKYVNKLNDERLDTNDEKYQLVQAQLNAFEVLLSPKTAQ